MTHYFGNICNNDGYARVTKFHITLLSVCFHEIDYRKPFYMDNNNTSDIQTVVIHGSFFEVPKIVNETKKKCPSCKVWTFVVNESRNLPEVWVNNLKHSDGFLYLSSWNYDQHHKYFPGKPGVVIHSWIPSPRSSIVSLGFKHPFADFKYRFYTIAMFNPRKNIDFLIRGFLDVFAFSSDAALFVKAGFDFPDLEIQLDIILKLLQEYETYPHIFFEWKYQSDEWINNLHRAGNIYINTSLGEATCLPLLDVPSKNSVIAPDMGGHCDYIKDFDRILTTPGKICFSPLFQKKMFWYYPEEVEWNIPDMGSYRDLLKKVRGEKYTFGHVKFPETNVQQEWENIYIGTPSAC